MRVSYGIASVVLAGMLSGAGAHAQTAEGVAKMAESLRPRVDYSTFPVTMYHLKNISQDNPNNANEIYTALRNLLPPQAKVYYVPSQAMLLMAGTPEEIASAQKMLAELDKPRKAYRLNYTITEVEGGKKMSTQHFSVIAEDGQRVTLKQGSKIPVATGSYNAVASNGNPQGAQTQFQYLDVGMNFDSTLTSTAGGGVLKAKVEQSSVAEDKTISGVNEPIIRQTTLEGTSVLTMGKPLMLGSVDVPGSTRHLDVEVMMELVP